MDTICICLDIWKNIYHGQCDDRLCQSISHKCICSHGYSICNCLAKIHTCVRSIRPVSTVSIQN